MLPVQAEGTKAPAGREGPRAEGGAGWRLLLRLRLYSITHFM
jgi:hypothetical protein